MTGTAVALLLMLAVGVLGVPGRVGREGGAGRSRPVLDGGPQVVLSLAARLGRRVHRPRAGSTAPDELPMFVHRMAGLLRAGRPPHLLWSDLERVYADEETGFAAEASPVVSKVRRASALGLSIPEALREATCSFPGGSGGGPASAPTDRLWADLAGCLTVAERSGAPLAAILDHYAAQLEADLDGIAARETALAGPRATVVLLTWLPVVGLLLGFVLGAEPVAVLLGTSIGRVTLLVGVLLLIVSRSWSRHLVRRAGTTR